MNCYARERTETSEVCHESSGCEIMLLMFYILDVTLLDEYIYLIRPIIFSKKQERNVT